MKKEFILQINKKSEFPYLSFGTDYKKSLWEVFTKESNGKRVRVTVDEDISYDTRKFFEGAVVPYFFYQSDLAFRTFEEARESLKSEFGKKTYKRGLVGPKRGRVETIAISTAKYNKADFQALLDKIHAYFEENQFEFPNSEEYKKWRDSAPGVGEVYPPLKSLHERFLKRVEKLSTGK